MPRYRFLPVTFFCAVLLISGVQGQTSEQGTTSTADNKGTYGPDPLPPANTTGGFETVTVKVCVMDSQSGGPEREFSQYQYLVPAQSSWEWMNAYRRIYFWDASVRATSNSKFVHPGATEIENCRPHGLRATDYFRRSESYDDRSGALIDKLRDTGIDGGIVFLKFKQLFKCDAVELPGSVCNERFFRHGDGAPSMVKVKDGYVLCAARPQVQSSSGGRFKVVSVDDSGIRFFIASQSGATPGEEHLEWQITEMPLKDFPRDFIRHVCHRS